MDQTLLYSRGDKSRVGEVNGGVMGGGGDGPFYRRGDNTRVGEVRGEVDHCIV